MGAGRLLLLARFLLERGEQVRRSNALSSDGAFYVAKILADRGEKDLAQKILEEVIANEPMFAMKSEAADLLATLKKESGEKK